MSADFDANTTNISHIAGQFGDGADAYVGLMNRLDTEIHAVSSAFAGGAGADFVTAAENCEPYLRALAEVFRKHGAHFSFAANKYSQASEDMKGAHNPIRSSFGG